MQRFDRKFMIGAPTEPRYRDCADKPRIRRM
jgi:hypothetical protein